MSHFIVLAFLIGVVAGLRCLTAPALVSWAVQLGWLRMENASLAFMGYYATPVIFSVLAIGELINDLRPTAPSRKALPGFIARILTGALCGAVFGAAGESVTAGVIAGIVGAIVGTLGGYEARVRLANAIGKDLPIALIEDAVAIGSALLLVSKPVTHP